MIILDGVVGDFIVEIKCPYSARDTDSFVQAINDKKVRHKILK